MKDNVIFYSKEDVSIAEWILNNQHLNQGIPAIMWALRVVTWYVQFYAHVMHLKMKLYNVSLKECLCRTVNLIKDGRLLIRDTPYYHPGIAD